MKVFVTSSPVTKSGETVSMDTRPCEARSNKLAQGRLYLVVLAILLSLIVAIIWTLSAIEFRNIQHIEHHHTHYSIAPEQIHLSLGANDHQIVVTWMTTNQTEQSKVWYGEQSLNTVSSGQQTRFTDCAPDKRTLYIHRVALSGLKPNTTYKYNVGCNASRSEQYYFRTFPDQTSQTNGSWSPTVAVFNDLTHSFSKLTDDVGRDLVDLVMQLGSEEDQPQKLKPDNTKITVRMFEPIRTRVPIQMVPGSMSPMMGQSTQQSKSCWSQDVGPAHFITFSTELYSAPTKNVQQIKAQYKWLEEDLRKANQVHNRNQHPWIIAMGHRPFYDLDEDDGDEVDETVLRNGNEVVPGLEKLFRKYKVDLQLFGHVSTYERLWPVFGGVVYNGSSPYINPKAPVHIATGSGKSKITSSEKKSKATTSTASPLVRPNLTAVRNSDPGFTRLHLLNGTHLRVQQVSDLMDSMVDDFFMVKDSPFPRFDSLFDELDSLFDNMGTGFGHIRPLVHGSEAKQSQKSQKVNDPFEGFPFKFKIPF